MVEKMEVQLEGTRGSRVWLRAVVGIVRTPQARFRVIHQEGPWFGVSLLLSLATVIQGLVAAPYTREAMSQALIESGFRPGEVSPVILYSGVALSPALAFSGWVLDAVLIWLLAMAFGSSTTFRRAFSLTVHLAIVSFLGGLGSFLGFLVNRALGRASGPDDMGLPLGLNLILPTDSVTLEVLYSRINPFTLWFVVLLALGSVTVFGLGTRRGWMVAGTHWATTTMLLVATRGLPELLAR